MSEVNRCSPLTSLWPVPALIALLSLTMLIAPANAANLIANGSFASVTPALSTNEICTSDPAVFPYSACTAAGWTGKYQVGEGATVGIFGASFGIPQPDPVGNNALILQQSSTAIQSVDIPSAGLYDLTFYIANRSNIDNGPQTIAVSWGGTTLDTYTDLPGSWTLESLDFSTAPGTHTLEFFGIDPSGQDVSAFINDVVLTTATPEPSSITLLAFPLLALLLCRVFFAQKWHSKERDGRR